MFPFANKREATFKDGCLSLRQNVLDSLRAKTGPGPIYNPKPRVSSTEKSLRNISFGTETTRNNVGNNKKKVGSRPGPGPQTYDPDAIRKAPQSNKRSVNGFSFGASMRACNTPDHTSSKLPSPAEYDPESIRRGIMFSKKGTSSVKFGTAQYNSKKHVDLPGPQSYDPAAIKRGIMCTKSSMTSVKFGSPPRRPATAPEMGSRASIPGPQHYETENIRAGIYSLSTKKKPAGVIFSTGPRTYNDIEERERASKPGPNAYSMRYGSALGKQVNSRYKSQPSISFGSR